MRVVGAFCVVAMLLMAGCGSSDTQNANGAGSGGVGTTGGTGGTGGTSSGATGTNAVVAPEICAEYGIEFSPDCSDCPQTPLSRECFAGTLVFPEVACTFGNCITAVDCDRVCRNAGDPANPQSGDLANPNLGTDVFAIQDCVKALTFCDSGDDDECGDGKCVFDPAFGGRCSTGDDFQACKEANDCQSGFCVSVGADFARCASGEPGAACDNSDQCLAGTCIEYTPGPADFAPDGPGFCTSGLPDELCTEDEQCVAPAHCVPEVPGRVLASCSPGEIGDLCNDAGDCQSGFCFVWGDIDPQQTGVCTAGAFRDPCIDGADCESGYCSRVIENTSGGGSCVPGDALSPCYDNDDCASGHCALLIASSDPEIPSPIAEGLCTTGASGDPCDDNGECLSAACVNPEPTESAACPFAPSSAGATPCENDGVCSPTGACFPGKCE
jgi:hypothetical protein